jgi:hypothetical protein
MIIKLLGHPARADALGNTSRYPRVVESGSEAKVHISIEYCGA